MKKALTIGTVVLLLLGAWWAIDHTQHPEDATTSSDDPVVASHDAVGEGPALAPVIEGASVGADTQAPAGRRPMIAGVFLGLAAGLVYYPLFLLPLVEHPAGKDPKDPTRIFV